MNNINLLTYAAEINQFLNEARLKNIDFDKDTNLSMKERGVARGIYNDSDTNSGSSASDTSTMNVDFNTKPQQEAPEQPQNQEEQSQNTQSTEPASNNSGEFEKLQLSYKKIINFQKKFAAFKKQCENSEMTVEDVIKAAQGSGEQVTGEQRADEQAPPANQSQQTQEQQSA